jgi:SAM-dependent methyltransferase
MAGHPSTDEPTVARAELEALKARLDALEREQAERTARANAAIAAAQDKSYWLDRWHVDLNELMRRRGAAELRAGFRLLRSVYRLAYNTRSRLKASIKQLPLRAEIARIELSEERERGKADEADRFRRTVSPDHLRASPVTDRLYARLEADDLRAVEARMEAPEAALWETAAGADRKRLALAFAAHYGVQAALDRTGLRAAMPPPEVHSMARSPAAAGGSTYYADLVVDALERTGLTPAPGQAWLDFGCSSGRVVRVLAAAYPEVGWHGCDPIPDAIAWARERLPEVNFEHSPDDPPLPYAPAAFDAVFAISIWSHFSEPAALRWLEEMWRIVRPGGRLLLTTHGGQTIAHTFETGERSAEQLDEVRHALYAHGFWYAPEFGERGDHGVVNPDWGTAFLTPEWLLARLTPRWRLALFVPGPVELNQDLYVLERG